jgi:DNA polymerase-3 subunit delta
MGAWWSSRTAGGSRSGAAAEYDARVTDLKPAYLVVGSDRPKVSRALQRLRARVGEGGIEVLSAREASGDDAVAACNALGLFGGEGRLVLVEEVERWKAPDAKIVAAYLASPAPATVLALTGDLKADSPIGKAVAKHGDVLAYDVARRAFPRWVADQFARVGATADEGACRALVETVGDNLDELAAEVDKLATWADGEPIGQREVQALAAGRADTAIFALTDAWGRRDVAAVLAASEGLLERSARPRRDELPRLVGALVSHVSLVHTCRRLSAEGVRPRDAASALRKHPFVVEKAFTQSANFSDGELDSAVVRLAELDAALKGGSRLPGDLELQRALVAVTRPAEPAVAQSGQR